MPLACGDQHKRDVKALAGVAEVLPEEVRGFTLVLYLDTDDSVMVTNACCARHAMNDLACLIEHRIPELVPCSDEH